MNYTKTQRKRMANAFKEAKKILGPGHSYICHCIGAAAHQHRISQSTADLCKMLINDRLQGHMVLDSWLIHVAGIDKVLVRNDYAKMRATRHAWLDSLIKEFSS